MAGRSWQTALVDDKELLARAEQALTEIKINQGLSERHASVLAALRIRLKGSDTKSLEEMLEAADDPGPESLEERFAEAERTPKRSLDDLFAKEPKPKPDWPS
jgi:guanylate kinase